MSALLEPIFGTRTHGALGATVDIFAIIVTLFGTAVSLGIGALQIGRGVEIVGGLGPLANGALVAIIALLAVASSSLPCPASSAASASCRTST